MYEVQEDDGEGDDEVEVVGVEVEAEEGWGGQEEGVSRQEARVLAGVLIPQPMVGGVEEAENAAALAAAEAEAANPNPNPVTLALALALTLTLTLTLALTLALALTLPLTLTLTRPRCTSCSSPSTPTRGGAAPHPRAARLCSRRCCSCTWSHRTLSSASAPPTTTTVAPAQPSCYAAPRRWWHASYPSCTRTSHTSTSTSPLSCLAG